MRGRRGRAAPRARQPGGERGEVRARAAGGSRCARPPGRTGARSCCASRTAGPGIPRDERERVFEPFYRGPAAERNATPGSGLGLSLVRHVVRAHGGRVHVEGARGRGRGRRPRAARRATAERRGRERPRAAGRGRADPRPDAHGPAARRGLRGRLGRDRRRGLPARPRRVLRHRPARRGPPRQGRLRRPARPAPAARGHAGPDAHRPRPGRGPRARPEAGRRRLPAEALRHDGAARAHRGGAAAPAGRRPGRLRQRSRSATCAWTSAAPR